MNATSSRGNISTMNKTLGINKTSFSSQNRINCNGINPKLHSTALNNTTFLEKTNIPSSEEFSTTVVGQKGFHTASLASLSELPDISHISKFSNESETFETTAISVPSEQEDEVFEQDKRDISLEEINDEYLKYLIHALIDVRSNSSFNKQMKEAKKQITFLTNSIEEEQEELSQEKRKLELLCHYNKVSQNHKVLKEKLSSMTEITTPSTEALAELTLHLERQLNQIKLENIYQHADNTSYKEDFEDALKQNLNLLQDINDILEPRTNRLQSLSQLGTDLIEEVDAMSECLYLGEKAASLSLQESSFKLTLGTVNDESI